MSTHLHPLRALLSVLAVVTVVLAGLPASAIAAPVAGSTAAFASDEDPPPPTDSDGDGVTDDVDQCPDLAGSSAYNGCLVPDSDGDGVYDDSDACPSDPGTPQYSGCPAPDSDGDGLTDDVDACPDLPGPYDGCPLVDFDGDGVTDDVDQCPNVAGSWSNNGCPEDSDGDGVTDDVDQCPFDYGATSDGCPPYVPGDEDGDGVDDDHDGCPGTQQGENVDTSGCSLTQLDSDNDGVDDEHDACASTPSDTEVDDTGCPVVVEVTPGAVTFSDPCGHGKDSFVVPTTTGVTYRRAGKDVAAGTYAAHGSVRVKAVAESGYSLSGTTSWHHRFSDRRCRTGRVSVSSPQRGTVRIVNRESQPLTFTTRGRTWRVEAGATRTVRLRHGAPRWQASWADYFSRRTGRVTIR